MKELWFSEYHSEDVKLSVRIRRELYSHRSRYQEITILDSFEYGRLLCLDGCIMLSEKDQFIYHEMITHVPLAVHPRVRSVLVIGAGNGGCLRELCLYPEIETIDLVEIDAELLGIVQEFFPKSASSFRDPRVRIQLTDGLQFVRHVHDCYDLIIVDNPDPFGPGESLFTREFYGNCFQALRGDGILINQHESPFYPEDAREVRNTHQKTKGLFPVAKIYQAHIPTYPMGHWLLGFISKKYDPVADLDAERFTARGLRTRYYNPKLHQASFALPTYLLDLLAGRDMNPSP